MTPSSVPTSASIEAQNVPFDPRAGSWLERLLFNHRAWIVLVCVLVTALLGTQVRHLRLNASFERMLPATHPFVLNYREHRADLGGQGNLLRLVVENQKGTIYDAAYLDALRRLNDELFLWSAIDRPYMKSLWTPATRWIGVTEQGLDGGPVMPDDYNGSAGSLERVRANVERSGEIGQLVAPDLRSSVILLPLLDHVDGAALDYRDLSERLEGLRARYSRDGLQVHITGFAKVVGDLIDGLRQMLLFFVVTLAICTAVLYAYTRCLRSTLLVVVCSLIAVGWLLGLLPLLGFELDPYSVLVPFLVFAIGMSHGAQKMNGIVQDIGRGVDQRVAARLTFRRLFLAGLTALLADAVGFAVLMVIDIPVIQDLAITASIGVACLIFTNLVLLPILLSYTGVSRSAAQRSLRDEAPEAHDDPSQRHPFWSLLDRFTDRRWASRLLCAAALLGAMGAWVSTGLKIGDLDAGAPELRPDSRYNLDSAYVNAHYAASSDVYVVMVRTPQYQCVNYDVLDRIDALEWRLQQLPGVESTSSFVGLAKQSTSGMNEGSAKWFELPRTQDMLNAVATRAPRDLFNQACDLSSVYIFLRDHRADTLDAVSSAVETFAAENETAQVKFLQAAGNAGFEAATNRVVRRANHQMLLLVYVAVILLAAVTFRSWRAVVCAVLPLMLTSVLCEALMVWLGIGVKVATLPVIALGVGIGVDYSLYILTVTLAQMRAGASLSTAYYRALLFTGRVVVLTGLTLGIGVALWVFAPIKFQADMGVLLAFMFVWNMLGALLLLPALGHFLLRPIAAAPLTKT